MQPCLECLCFLLVEEQHIFAVTHLARVLIKVAPAGDAYTANGDQLRLEAVFGAVGALIEQRFQIPVRTGAKGAPFPLTHDKHTYGHALHPAGREFRGNLFPE